MSFTDFAFILFLPMVFIGAFFLVNLLLAVINSSFRYQEQRATEEDPGRERTKKVEKEGSCH